MEKHRQRDTETLRDSEEAVAKVCNEGLHNVCDARHQNQAIGELAMLWLWLSNG